MKKLNIETGGHLASNDDLMHLEKKTTHLVEVIFKAMLRNPQISYKLYGCQVSEDVAEGTLKVTAGAIFHQKEFFLVKAQSIPLQAGSALYGFKITDNPDAPGTKVIYATGTEVTPHQDKIMILTYTDFDLADTTLEQFNFKHLTPNHLWSGTKISFEQPDGTWGPSVDLRGPQGLIGNRPAHQWSGTQLRIQNSNGSWGSWVNLKGQKGDKGNPGAVGPAGDNANLKYLRTVRGFIERTTSHDFLEFQYDDGTTTRKVYMVATLSFG